MSLLRCSSVSSILFHRIGYQSFQISSILRTWQCYENCDRDYWKPSYRSYSKKRFDLLSNFESDPPFETESFVETKKTRPPKKVNFKNPESLEKIRAELREKYKIAPSGDAQSKHVFDKSSDALYRLEDNIAKPYSEFSQHRNSPLDEEFDADESIASASKSLEVSEEERQRQATFIRNLKNKNEGKHNLKTKKEEAVIDMSYGFMRLDSMNRRGNAQIDTGSFSIDNLKPKQFGTIDKETNHAEMPFRERNVSKEKLSENADDLCIKSNKTRKDSVVYKSTGSFPSNFVEDLTVHEHSNAIDGSAGSIRHKVEIDSNDSARSIEVDTTNTKKTRNNVKREIDSSGNDEHQSIFDEQYFTTLISSHAVPAHVSKPNYSREIKDNHLVGCERGSSSSNIFEEQYFGVVNKELTSETATDKKKKNMESGVNNAQNLNSTEEFPASKNLFMNSTETSRVYIQSHSGEGSIFDEQYFESLDAKSIPKPISKVSPPESKHSMDSNNLHDSSSKEEEEVLKSAEGHINFNRSEDNIHNSNSDKTNSGSHSSLFLSSSETRQKKISAIQAALGSIKGTSTFRRTLDESEETEFHEQKASAWEKFKDARPLANVENPTTGYDLAMKLRLKKSGKLSEDPEQQNNRKARTEQTTSSSSINGTGRVGAVLPRESTWTGRVDSKGFKILKDQVIDVQNMTQDDLVNVIKNSVIYQDDNLLVIDKPYGLPSHGGPGIHHSVGKLLEPLSDRLDRSRLRINSLHLVHRLDKETTGVMILAKSQQMAELLLAMFKKRQVIKHYWLITKGIPNPTEGVIDIPMGEGVVEGRYRMELRPNHKSIDKSLLCHINSDATTGYETFDAVTEYRVLSSNYSAALVECTPQTGVKHQIRCHMAFALNTPILGDHKYSHYTKMSPQRLHPEILQRLGVRQAKVRHIPMHLHAKSVVLPEFKGGRNLFLSARLPKHFVQNMNWLKLKPLQ